ncbi:Transmembrane and coiled-coil domain-containing protein 4 [Kickxella alabastrina]|uniref:Transmembrane and coiled-coil domain-containing protein 4 n=1 Tax=Kickxella alabastrina TaxID=61397 RepID=A0ACC1IDG6_9FUNG|nr:Transmembrane and coiled-coil domain-containing protein 4 [Kickxella alabastrina]
MELLEVKDSLARHWLAALCICSGRCVMAAGGGAESRAWSEQFAQSVLEWLHVPEADWADLRAMPHGDAANDMALLMLRCMRSDEEAAEAGAGASVSLEVASDPDRLAAGLVLACLGLGSVQAAGTLPPLEYDARSRAAAFAVCAWLGLPSQLVGAHEALVAGRLERAAGSGQLGDASARALNDDRRRKWGWGRRLAAGAGVVVAGTLVGVTAGLAAPLMAAGLGAVGIGGLGFLATGGGAAMAGSLLGVAGGGVAGQRFNTRLRGLREFYFTQLARGHALHATVLVPGFLAAAAAASPFAPVRDAMGLDLGDAYTLYFEPAELAALQGAVSRFASSSARSAVVSAALAQTALAGLLGAFTWPLAALKLGQLIDSPWAVGIERARRAGRLLADVLESHAHGTRPVTLVGYSLSALAVVTCLQELHSRGAFGVVETAVLLGVPADSTAAAAWAACCHCVSRRLIIGHSRSDWVLAFLFRASALCVRLAGLEGLAPAALFPDSPLMRRKVVNVDLGDIVSQHADYLDRLDDIMLEVSRHL